MIISYKIINLYFSFPTGLLAVVYMTICSNTIFLIHKQYLILIIFILIHIHFLPLPKNCTHLWNTVQTITIISCGCSMNVVCYCVSTHRILMVLKDVSSIYSCLLFRKYLCECLIKKDFGIIPWYDLVYLMRQGLFQKF